RTVFGRGATRQREVSVSGGEGIAAPVSTGAHHLNLATGDIVVHRLWGEGEVISTGGSGDEAEAEVKFGSVGRKKLLLRMAPLKRA
ncbi:MAG: ATP-dependent DNA helicase PcrA, partial [Acidimicrobiales bacterium]